jgi:D-galactonate transporter
MEEEFERQTLAKVTRRLIPFLFGIYVVAYLDRVNVSFAQLQLKHDLDFSDTIFGLGAGIFSLGYVIFGVPSNLMLARVGARRWLAAIMIAWGLISASMVFITGPQSFYTLRFLLGAAEAGFFPGIILYLTFWFPAEYRARAVGWFMVAVPISTAVGSTVSALIIAHGDGLFGLSGWRVMFLFEGIPAIVLGIVTLFALTDRPEQARWLADDERSWLRERLDAEAAQVQASGHWPLRRALTAPRILVLAFVYFGVTYGLYALGFFLPTIVSGFEQQYGTKLDIVQKGLVTSVPYVAAAVGMVLWSRAADRAATRRDGGFLAGEQGRRWWLALPMIVGGIAIPIALYLRDPFSAMAAVTICAVGTCAGLPTFWPLPSQFLTGAAAAGGIALINSLGNVSGFVAPYVTGGLADLTGSQRAGLWVVGIVTVLGAITALLVGRRTSQAAALDPPG